MRYKGRFQPASGLCESQAGVVIPGVSVMDTASRTDRRLMHRVSETPTISLERPRKAILALLYVVFCFAFLVLVVALADAALLLISRFG